MTADEFIHIWNESESTGQIASLTGLGQNTVKNIGSALRVLGYNLKSFRKGVQGETNANPIERLVYFARQHNLIKIGISKNVPKRLIELGRKSEPLILLGTVAGDMNLERELHERFRSFHSHDEWFIACDELYDAIAKICAK